MADKYIYLLTLLSSYQFQAETMRLISLFTPLIHFHPFFSSFLQVSYWQETSEGREEASGNTESYMHSET